VVLANLGSEIETCVGSRVHLVGVSISFENNFYRLPFTAPSLVRHFGPSEGQSAKECIDEIEKKVNAMIGESTMNEYKAYKNFVKHKRRSIGYSFKFVVKSLSALVARALS
jgi:hypothetical protein